MTTSPVAALTSGGPPRKIVPSPADDHGLVAHRRHVGAPGGARAHHRGELGDARRRHPGLVEEDPAEVVPVREHLVLQREVGPARVDQVAARQAGCRRRSLAPGGAFSPSPGSRCRLSRSRRWRRPCSTAHRPGRCRSPVPRQEAARRRGPTPRAGTARGRASPGRGGGRSGPAPASCCVRDAFLGRLGPLPFGRRRAARVVPRSAHAEKVRSGHLEHHRLSCLQRPFRASWSAPPRNPPRAIALHRRR